MADPKDEKWTDDRLLHEGVWIVENWWGDFSEVAAWAAFVRKVWAERDAVTQTPQRNVTESKDG